MNTLKQFGFVGKDPHTKAYSLGPGLLFLSRNVLDHLDLRDVVTPFLDKLAAQTQSTALFGLLSEEPVFVIGRLKAEPGREAAPGDPPLPMAEPHLRHPEPSWHVAGDTGVVTQDAGGQQETIPRRGGEYVGYLHPHR